MSHQELERTLRDLPRHGEKIFDGPERQVWVFEFGGKRHRLHFYRRAGMSRALREFSGLTALQRAGVAGPKAVAMLSGLKIGAEVGDAVVVDEVRGFERVGEEGALSRKQLVREQLFELVKRLGQAKLGHSNLRLDAFAVDESGRMLIADGEAITGKGLMLDQVLRLGHSARRVATRGDLLRAWQAFGFGAEMPTTNSFSSTAWRRFARQSVRGEGEYFGSLSIGGWRGRFSRKAEATLRWTPTSRVTFDNASWNTAWPLLLTAIENDQLEILKRGDNGDVLRGQIVIHGVPLDVVVKRPKRKTFRQTVVDAFRPSRARRTWIKTWKMLIRDIPCEYPLLVMERKKIGYVIDAVVVFGAVDGPTLADIDLDAMPANNRVTLFHRVGRTLRRIESLGFTHMDAKSTNWIVFDAASASPLPVLVDVDGVRHYQWAGAGIRRLLRAMKQHAQYTPADSHALCTGYAPRATIAVESSQDQPA